MVLKNALFVMTLLLAATASAQDGDRKGSPFEALRWTDGAPEVLVRSTWYRPLVIEGVEVHAILAFCERTWPGMARKRFGEDLIEAMERMGHDVPDAVTLRLERIDDGKAIELADVEMSMDNREAIRRAAADVHPRRAPDAPKSIERAQALADIAEFERGLDDQFAYRAWRGIDLAGALDALGKTLGENVATGELAAELNRIIARFGDGHAGVSSEWAERAALYPPFLLADARGGVVAFAPDRSGFLDDERPYITAIDGKPIDLWIEAASRDVTDGSAQLVRERSLRALRDLELLRPRLDVEQSGFVRCTLAGGPNDADPVDVTVRMTPRRPTFGSWPRSETAILGDGIGYLRLDRMDDDLVSHLRSAMTAFRDTRGLIVDVRGNGGGSRDLLIALAGYLQAPDEHPWVANIARYRLSDRFDEDHLDARFMYPADDPRWTDAQRRAIAGAAADFEPEWKPGDGFSAWHFLVLGRTGDAAEYFYDKPVVILSDAVCFSATDIFLGALIGRPRVTVMGTPSGGGSARSMRFTLPNSGIQVRCASMASFRPDGRLYDGRGIEVDVEAECEATDVLTGRGDTVLEAALERLGG